MQTISTDAAPCAIGPYSQAIVHNDWLFTSGQIPLDPATGALVTGDVEAQTHRVCQNLHAVLRAAGFAPESVVKTTCFLTNMADFAAFNAVYAAYFPSCPARSCVAVAALPKGAALEVELIAAR